jgi:molybdate transport system substrate-binding protein
MSFYKVMKIRFLFVMGIWFLSLVSCNGTKPEKFTIAAAANMQFAVAELASAYAQQTGNQCDIVTSSSGKLTAQVIEGAPFDILLSADMKFPEEIYKKGLSPEKPIIYAYGSLILWTLKENVEPNLDFLKKESIQHIAMGNPKTAPYGISAMEVLVHSGMNEELKDKLVFGESISQTNQFIVSRVADIGFTSKSVIMSSLMKDQGAWKEVDKDLYSPIAQGLVIINNRKTFQKEAKQFKDFVLSSKGKEILIKFGYEVVN